MQNAMSPELRSAPQNTQDYSLKKLSATPIAYVAIASSLGFDKECVMSAAPSFGMESSAAKAAVGTSVVIKGHVLSREDLTINGEVEGTIEVPEHRLTIAANARVRADVKARDIEIWGYVEGKVVAVNQVHIHKAGRFVGEIHSAGIVIEEGGYIKGSIDLSRRSTHSHPTPEDASSTDSHRNISKVEPIRQLSEAVLKS